MRALGRHHALMAKQDRIRLLFDIMLRTICSRLGSQVQHGVMDAWRFHFDIIYVEMTRDKIRLYPDLHSARVSSNCSSASGYHSCGEEEQQLLLQGDKEDVMQNSLGLELFSLDSDVPLDKPSINFVAMKASWVDATTPITDDGSLSTMNSQHGASVDVGKSVA